MDATRVEAWVNGYEQLWRHPGTERLGELFAPDASYQPSPWAAPVVGIDLLAAFWEAERSGPAEGFSMSSTVVAVERGTAVVRVSVDYDDPSSGCWRNLWVVELDEDGRCSSFEEWPFAPEQPDGH